MTQPPVYIVHLRRPRMSDPNERRSDPFYEFGSFGCTGCHRRNLMNPKNVRKLIGARLAFAQGGPLGFRLVYLTPVITLCAWDDRTEARWTPAGMPFRYEVAPVLAFNDREGDFPAIEKLARETNRTTIEGGFSSRFRTRGTPLDAKTADELVQHYVRFRQQASAGAIAVTYAEALPETPPLADHQRRHTYQKQIKNLRLTSQPQADLNPSPPSRNRRCC